MDDNLDRRVFLKNSLIAGAVALAGGSALVGCTPTSTEESPSSTTTEAAPDALNNQPSYMNRSPIGEPSETVKADFIVCGAGGCGLSAALQAQELGLNVILLEKKETAGGTFGFSEVTFAVGSRFQTEAGIEKSLEEVIRDILEYNHYIPSHALLQAWLAQSADTIDWVQTFGCEFEFRQLTSLNSFGHFYKGDTLKGAGFEFIQHFIDTAEQRGIDIRYKTAAKELLVENEKVTGILAVYDDKTVIKFEAPAVLVSTGGWGNNEEMLRALAKVNPERVTASGYDGRDGDGVIMARSAGAAFARGEGTVMFYGPLVPGSNWGDELQTGAAQCTLWVNESGERFMDEGGPHQMHRGMTIRDLKRMFVIQSQADVDFFTDVGPWITNSGHTPKETPMTKFRELLQNQIDTKNERIFVADTIEELAEKAGIDKDTFAATVSRYNELVDKGIDEDFLKPVQYLTPLKEGPFYAFESNDAFYTTVGGVKINANTQVLDENGEVIPGLYAGGVDAGGLCGDTYDFQSAPGEQSSWAMNSGRLAAKHAAEYIKG